MCSGSRERLLRKSQARPPRKGLLDMPDSSGHRWAKTRLAGVLPCANGAVRIDEDRTGVGGASVRKRTLRKPVSLSSVEDHRQSTRKRRKRCFGAGLLRIIIAYNAFHFFLPKEAAGLYAATGVSKAGVTSRTISTDESGAALHFMLGNKGLLITDAAPRCQFVRRQHCV
jgi:hypothetical protein